MANLKKICYISHKDYIKNPPFNEKRIFHMCQKILSNTENLNGCF